MKKLLKYLLPILGLLSVAGIAYGASPFSSQQLAPSPQSGYCLSTDGANPGVNSWIACSSGGGGGSGGGFSTSSPNFITTSFPSATGAMVGINSSTPRAILVVKGITGTTTPTLIIASSSNASLLTVASNGSTTLSSLGTGLVRSSAGSLYTDTTTYLTSAITSLNSQTGSTQTFATSSSGTVFDIQSSGDVHTFIFPATIPITGGGTNQSSYTSGGVVYYDGTQFVGGSNINYNGSSLSISSGSPSYTALLDVNGSFRINGEFLLNASAGNSGELLVSQGAGNPPQWNSITGLNLVTTSRNINTTAPLTGGGDLSSDRTIAIPQASSGIDGYLSGTDWNTFNSKVSFSSSSVRSLILPLLANGTVAGVNATSSTVNFLVQGTSAIANQFRVASSSGFSSLNITQAGNVGIGSDNIFPLAPLDVRQGGAGILSPIRLVNNTGNTGGGTFITFGASVAGGDPGGNDNASIGSMIMDNTLGTYVADFVFGSAYAGVFNKEKMRLTGEGRLGIGSSTPTAMLVVQGTTTTANLPLLRIASSTGSSLFTIASNGSTTLSSLGTGCVGAFSGSLYIAASNCTSGTGSSYWQTTTNGIFNGPGTAGYLVGINSTTPTATLVVQGSSTAPTLPLLRVASSTGFSMLTLSSLGQLAIQTPVNTTSAFSLKNASGTEIVSMSTVDPGVGLTFEVASTSGTTLLGVYGNGSTTIPSLTGGAVYSTSGGGLFNKYVPRYFPTRLANVASTTLSAYDGKSFGTASTTFELPGFGLTTSLTRIVCKTRVGSVNIHWGNGTSFTDFVATTGGATSTPSITFVKDQLIYVTASSSTAGADGLVCAGENYPTE